MINVLINGINGHMGQEVLKQIKQNTNFNVICGVDAIDNVENDCSVYTNIIDVKLVPDVIIDFSVPVATFEILKYAQINHIPIVVATTGFSNEQNEKIKRIAKNLPIFKSSNMSYEINIMSELVANLAKKLSDSDIEIVETHHNRKIDAPSGTALMLANSINTALDNQMNYEYDRHSKHEKRSKNEIGIHSLRGGTEVGTHTVYFFGENESLEIKHTSTSRSIFAKGALKAAQFIIDKPNGLYDMKNLN